MPGTVHSSGNFLQTKTKDGLSFTEFMVGGRNENLKKKKGIKLVVEAGKPSLRKGSFELGGHCMICLPPASHSTSTACKAPCKALEILH